MEQSKRCSRTCHDRACMSAKRERIKRFGIVTQTLEVTTSADAMLPNLAASLHGQADRNVVLNGSIPNYKLGNGLGNVRTSLQDKVPSDRRPSAEVNSATALNQYTSELFNFNCFQLAFQNVSLAVFAWGCVLAAIAAYLLFVEFVKPLTWAVICGIIIYPLKREMTDLVKHWLDGLSESNTPLAAGVAILPLQVLDGVGECLFRQLVAARRFLVFIVLAVPCTSLAIQQGIVPKLFSVLSVSVRILDVLLALFSGQSALLFFVTCQLLQIGWSQLLSIKQNPALRLLSLMSWLTFLAYCSNRLGHVRSLFFSAFVLVAVCCKLYRNRRKKLRGKNSSGSTSEESTADSKLDALEPSDESTPESNLYLRWLFLACFFVYLSLHLWLLCLVVIPLFVFAVKHLVMNVSVAHLFKTVTNKVCSRLQGVSEFMLPHWVRAVFAVLLKVDRMLIAYLKSSMDVVGSIVAMVVLLFAIIAILLFIISQLYYESVHIVTLATNLANHTLTHNVKLQQWMQRALNVSTITDAAEMAVQRCYDHSKDWLSQKIRNIVDDSQKAAMLEEQILTSLDSTLSYWVKQNDNNLNFSTTALTDKGSILSGWNQLLHTVWFSDDDDDEDWDFGVVEAFQANLSVLVTFMESMWTMLASNTEQIAGVIGEVLGSLTASGTAIVDFVLDMTVFLTILFQLLCSSIRRFKPLELLQYVTPNKSMAQKISVEIEEAVSSVFIVSLKMAAFYGFYTWLTHTLFGVNLVFVPSVLASIFAAIPFFGPYLVVMPGALELWLVRREPLLAIFLVLLHCIPGFVVDDAIYSEIKATHPLLTGMAIAGGMLWWGLQGVIFGPVVLCCILVVMKVYDNIMEASVTS